MEVTEKRVWVVRTSDEPVRFKSKSIPWEVKEKFSSPLGVRRRQGCELRVKGFMQQSLETIFR